MVELAQHIISCLLGLSVSAGFIALILKAHRLYKRPSREEELHHTHKVSIPRFGGIALAVAFVSVIWLFRIESNPHSTDGVASPPKSARGLAHSKTLRFAGSRRNSRQRFGLRRPSVAFPKSSPSRRFTVGLGTRALSFPTAHDLAR
jgi:hypothetical protein